MNINEIFDVSLAVNVTTLITVLGGFFYGISILRITLNLAMVKLERLAELADKHEHRISLIEERLGLRDIKET